MRVLRTLIEARNILSHSTLADRTGLSLPGVHKVISRLMETGIIQYIGSGSRQQIGLRKDHPMAPVLIELFKAEKENFKTLVTELKNLIKHLELKPDSSWIFGKVAQGDDVYGDPIQIAVLSNVSSVDRIAENFRDRLSEMEIERRYDVTIEVLGVTLAELEFRPILNTNKLIMLWGVEPQFYLSSSRDERGDSHKHIYLDIYSLENSRIWTELLKLYPEIIKRTIQYLNDRIQTTKSGEKGTLIEWREILESMSYQRLKKFLESDSERSTRLRQSLPFWPVLNDEEINKLQEIKRIISHENE